MSERLKVQEIDIETLYWDAQILESRAREDFDHGVTDCRGVDIAQLITDVDEARDTGIHGAINYSIVKYLRKQGLEGEAHDSKHNQN